MGIGSFTLLLCLLVVALATPNWAVEVGSEDASPPPPPKRRLFDDLSVEDYGDSAAEPTRPDNVDNEAIQGLVDRFLNKGTLEEDAKEAKEKLNKDAQKLVNSSSYWSTDDLKPDGSVGEKEKLVEWLGGYQQELIRVLHQVALAGWNYFTSASPLTKESLEEAEEVARLFLRASARQSRQFNVSVLGPNGRKQFGLIAKEGMGALGEEDFLKYNRKLQRINELYTTTSICDPPAPDARPPAPETCLLKFGDLPRSMQKAESAQQLLDWWQGWRTALGPNLISTYEHLIALTNQAAHLNNYTDGGAMWRSVFELPDEEGRPTVDIGEQIEAAFQQVLPFYKQLHAYIRPRLAAIYASSSSPLSPSPSPSLPSSEAQGLTSDGPIPAHLLKSLNADSWLAHYETTKPFASDSSTTTSTSTSSTEETQISEEVLASFHAQNYTVRTMFTRVYRFMKHLGFERLPKSVWMNSIFTRNWSKDNMICQPAVAYDMVDGDDYRIKVCAQLGEADFVLAHRLMSQLYGKYSARHLPVLLKEPSNPTIHSALAGAFEAIAMNTDYLKAQNLLGRTAERSEPSEINRLYKEALDQVVRLPFDVVADKWRYGLFEGRIMASKEEEWSQEWWALRERYQGVSAPNGKGNGSALLSAADAFDPLASPAIGQQHAPAARHFASYIAQFQILKAICHNSSSPLSQGCLPTREGMKKVIEVLSKGETISWVDALEAITGSRRLDASPLLQYYEPLIGWLENSNQHEGRTIGWEEGRGRPFEKSEIPELRKDSDAGDKASFSADGQIAFPGATCSNGQECLLDSVCNGTVCLCREGLYTLQIADTYNCVPGNPASAGFADNSGGLIIALHPNQEKEEAVGSRAGSGGNASTTAMPDHAVVHGNSATGGQAGAMVVLLALLAASLTWLM